MSVQSGINQALGAVGTALTLGSHLAEQKKANEMQANQQEIQKIEAEQNVFNAENALKANTESTMQKLVEAEREGTYKAPEKLPDETSAEHEARMVEDYQETLSDRAEDKYQAAMANVKHPAESKRVQAARIAANEVQDEINARKNLKFDLEIAKKKFKALGGKE